MKRTTKAPSTEAFVQKLQRCIAQVEADPSGYRDNPHLYGLLHHIYLRLCHGNIPDHAVPEPAYVLTDKATRHIELGCPLPPGHDGVCRAP